MENLFQMYRTWFELRHLELFFGKTVICLGNLVSLIH